MGVFSTISNYYIANAAVLWSSLSNYLHLLVLPLVMLMGVYVVYNISNEKTRRSLDNIIGCLSFISSGLCLITAVKFFITFICCIVSFLVRVF